MEICTVAVIVALVIIVVAYVVWRNLFSHLFKSHPEITINIASEVFPEIQKSHNSLTNLSAAAIVLTFSILEFFSNSCIVYKSVLVFSWICFALVVIFGLVANNFIYSYSLISKLLLDKISKMEDKKNKMEKVPEEERGFVDKNMPKMFNFKKITFISLYIQSIAFVLATLFITAFAILNVYKCP